MAELFILARLRAGIEAVQTDVVRFERRFALNPNAKLCIGDIALIPIDGTPFFPQHLREHWAHELDGGLFADFAIGGICGAAYGAEYTDHIDRFKGDVFTYGCKSQVFRQRWSWQQGWVDEEDGEDRPLVEDDETGDLADEPDDTFEDGSWSDEGDRLGFPRERECVEAEFETAGVLQWFRERRSQATSYGVGAKLVVVITREVYAKYEDGNGGRRLMQLLGPTATNVMRGERIACLAVRSDRPSHELFKYIKPALRPREVEDFIIFDIGQDVAVMRPGLSPLERWVERVLVRQEVVEAEELFQNPRRHASDRRR